MPSFRQITNERSARLAISEMSPHELLIYSPTSLRQVAPDNIPCHSLSTQSIDRQSHLLEDLVLQQRFERVVAIGGGTAIDMGKYAAYMADVPFVCIPSVLSTNAFSTDKVALYVQGKKITLNASMATEIVFDQELLASTDPLLHRFGLADVASIHTAAWDWRIAKHDVAENFDRVVFERSMRLLKSLRESVDVLDLSTADGLREVMELVGESGEITNNYGTGRPESGCEHILAKVLEHNRRVPHGVTISLGIMVGSILQQNEPAATARLIRQIGALEHPAARSIGPNELRDALRSVRPRPDRYSVFDKVELDERMIDDVVYRVGAFLATSPELESFWLPNKTRHAVHDLRTTLSADSNLFGSL